MANQLVEIAQNQVQTAFQKQNEYLLPRMELVQEIFTRKMNEAIDKIRIVAEEIFTRKISEAIKGISAVTGNENSNPNLPDISATQTRIRNENGILFVSPSVQNVHNQNLNKEASKEVCVFDIGMREMEKDSGLSIDVVVIPNERNLFDKMPEPKMENRGLLEMMKTRDVVVADLGLTVKNVMAASVGVKDVLIFDPGGGTVDALDYIGFNRISKEMSVNNIEMRDKLIETKTQLLLDKEHLIDKSTSSPLLNIHMWKSKIGILCTEIRGFIYSNEVLEEMIVVWFGDKYMSLDCPVVAKSRGHAHLSTRRPPPKPPPFQIGCCRDKIELWDGNWIECNAKCSRFVWYMEGCKFVAPVRLLMLAGCDMVVGVDFLRQLGPITFDFVHQNIHIQNQMMSSRELKKMFTKGKDAVMGCFCFISVEEAKRERKSSEELYPLLTEFGNVFETPKGLLPERSHDHRIAFKPRTEQYLSQQAPGRMRFIAIKHRTERVQVHSKC